MDLSDISPLADDADRVLAIGDPIDDIERNDSVSVGNLLAGARDQTRGARVLVGLSSLCHQRLILFAGQDCDLALAGLHSHRIPSSIIDVAAVSYGNDRDGLGVFEKDDAIVADAPPAPGLTFQPLHIAGRS